MFVSKVKQLEEAILLGFEEIKENKIKKDDFLNLVREFGNEFLVAIESTLEDRQVEELTVAKKRIIVEVLYKLTNNSFYNFSSFYNSKIKSMFLEKYPNATQIIYSRIFDKSSELEKDNKKDLSQFTLLELEKVLSELKPLTQTISHVNGRIITSYIDFCKGIPELNVNKNELKEQPMAWFDKFIDREIQLYLTDNELKGIIDDCANWQDMVILQLLWEGVQGNALAEIRNLKKDDINYETGEVVLTDEDGSTRNFVLSKRALFYIEKANDKHEYIKKNGKGDASYGSVTQLVQNSYVIRNSITKTDIKDKPVEKMVIYRRIKTLNETEGYPYLTAKNIVRSGIIHRGKQIVIDEGKKLDKDEYLKICEDYNISSWYQVQKYCNIQTIKKLYKKISNSNLVLV
jgi:hypothetical protein